MNNKIYPITLAIDFGTKRIGLAVNCGCLAEPYKILANDDYLFAQLKNILHEHKVEQIVVGISENKMAVKTKEFVKNFRKITKLSIKYADETLSSKIVQQKLVQAGVKMSKRRGPVDHYAAAVILQEWLDEK